MLFEPLARGSTNIGRPALPSCRRVHILCERDPLCPVPSPLRAAMRPPPSLLQNPAKVGTCLSSTQPQLGMSVVFIYYHFTSLPADMSRSGSVKAMSLGARWLRGCSVDACAAEQSRRTLWHPAATTCGVSIRTVVLICSCSAVSSRRAPRGCLASALRACVQLARSARVSG